MKPIGNEKVWIHFICLCSVYDEKSAPKFTKRKALFSSLDWFLAFCGFFHVDCICMSLLIICHLVECSLRKLHCFYFVRILLGKGKEVGIISSWYAYQF